MQRYARPYGPQKLRATPRQCCQKLRTIRAVRAMRFSFPRFPFSDSYASTALKRYWIGS